MLAFGYPFGVAGRHILEQVEEVHILELVAGLRILGLGLHILGLGLHILEPLEEHHSLERLEEEDIRLLGEVRSQVVA